MRRPALGKSQQSLLVGDHQALAALLHASLFPAQVLGDLGAFVFGVESELQSLSSPAARDFDRVGMALRAAKAHENGFQLRQNGRVRSVRGRKGSGSVEAVTVSDPEHGP